MRKRILAVAGVAALVMGTSAVIAGARGGVEYGGQIEKDPNTFIGFDVEGSGKHKTVEGLFTNGVSVACDNDAFSGRQGNLSIEKALKVKKNGSFKGKETRVLPVRAIGVPTKYKVSVKGKVKGKKAKGTVSVGLLGNDAHCYSGSLKWKAKKPAPAG